ncbi:MAG: hypothetical protein C4533_05110 [Candidatus Omnitrophota bacterium]|jgi:hypothetical protein|nr:MAG: hypothetical protein C4533_05110 [Candidatus Omnitrophota bacterium]
MEEIDFNNIKLDDTDKKTFDEIERLTEANSIGEALRCINHAVNGYLHRALLALENLQNGILDTEEKRKEAFTKVIQNSLKASLAAKELRKFYNL